MAQQPRVREASVFQPLGRRLCYSALLGLGAIWNRSNFSAQIGRESACKLRMCPCMSIGNYKLHYTCSKIRSVALEQPALLADS